MNTWLEVGLSNALVATGLALVAYGVTRVVRRPEIALVVWLLVMAKLLMPPLVSVPWAFAPSTRAVSAESGTVRQPKAAVERAVATSTVASEAVLAEPMVAVPDEIFGPRTPQHGPSSGRPAAMKGPRILTALSGVNIAAWWLAGSIAWFALAATRIVRFQRVLRHARCAPPELQQEVVELAGRLGLRRPPVVRLVRASMPPLVWALTGHATMVLPERLLASLSRDQRATLLAHELAHSACRDPLIRWLELAAVGLYWWHPVTWWARRNVERAQEQCCDARVVALLPQLKQAYAEALVATVDFLSEARPPIPLGASGFSQARLLEARMRMILQPTLARRTSWLTRLAVAMVGLLVLPLSIRAVSAQSSKPKSRPATAQAAVAADVGKRADKSGTVEQRLDRLEKMLLALTEEVRAMRNAQMESAPPVVIKTVPENGADDVDPGLTEIKVTFGKDMQDGSWSWTHGSPETFPNPGEGKIHYEKDKRTCVMPVKLEPGKTYIIGINSASFRNFTDKQGNSAIPYPLTFTTKK